MPTISSSLSPASSHRAPVGMLRIAVGPASCDCDLSLPISNTSPWQALIGPGPAPAETALDTLAAAADTWASPPQIVELVGPPDLCLLPAMWLRSIWLGTGAHLRLHWPSPESAPSLATADPRRQIAAQLCRAIVNSVHTPQPAEAWQRAGFVADDADAASGPSVFDLIQALLDHWDLYIRGADQLAPSDWLVAARKAFDECQKLGRKRICLYGSGTHTRALSPLLMTCPLEVLAIIDDNPEAIGTRLWGFPIVSREQAVALKPDAVILSANSFERTLWERSADLRAAGIPVMRLYTTG